MTEAWLVRQGPAVTTADTAAVTLVCVPHAGGGASAFNGWHSLLGAGIEVRCASLPGRERRFHEPARTSIVGVADRLADAVSALPGPVAFYGHSMGGLIATEVAHRLTDAGRPPVALFVAGTLPPGVRFTRKPVQEMDDAELVAWLQELGGLPSDLLADAQLLELLLPTVRADLLLCETHEYAPAAPLSCPVHAFAGVDDIVATPAAMRGWSATTDGGFDLTALPGGHFFVRSAAAELIAAIRARCLNDRRADTMQPHATRPPTAAEPVRELIAEVWRELLDVPGAAPFDPETPVFDAGADSLAMQRAATLLERLFRVEVPVRVLFETPTVAGQAEYVRRRGAETGRDVVTVAAGALDLMSTGGAA